MKLLLTIVLLSMSIGMSANDVKSVNIYTENVLMLKDSQLKDCEHISMDEDDVQFVNSIFESNKATSYSPVAPSAGGLFCVICFDEGEQMSVRITYNVIVAKKVVNNQESFNFYAPKDKEQLAQLATILAKYIK